MRAGIASGASRLTEGGAAAPLRQHLAQLSQALLACLCGDAEEEVTAAAGA